MAQDGGRNPFMAPFEQIFEYFFLEKFVTF